MIKGAPQISRPGLQLAKVPFAVFSNEYVFEICNQTLYPDEDIRNRPSRPIPAGLPSLRAGCEYFSWPRMAIGITKARDLA